MTTPSTPVGEMSWNAWGDPDRASALPESVRGLVASVLGVALRDAPAVEESALAVPPSALPAAARDALAAAVGPDHVDLADAARVRRTGGKSTPDLLRRRSGDVADAPDAVVRPASHAQVLDVLRACAEHRVAVVAFGGGTSVVGGVEPLHPGFEAVISLDLGRMKALLAVDPVSRTATLQPGLRTPEAEELLAAHGLTLGHQPQSYEYATIGGYAATRSSGQSSAGYGRFDAMVLHLRAATPRGTLDLGRSPGSAAGPDLKQLLLGSEGAFGVITEVTVRVRPLPEAQRDEAWTFPDFATGTAALRALAQGGVPPTLVRLSDETETFVNAALAGEQATGGCLAVVAHEGTAGQVASRRAETAAALEAAGGTCLGEEPVAQWRHSRYAGPYLRDGLLGAGVLAETLETATTWSRLPELREAVTEALTGALAVDGTPPVVNCHISHVYPEGASLYFTVAAAGGDDPAGRWERAKRAAGDAIAGHGGTITHHHAVGADHLPWMADEVGDLGVEVLRAVKRTLDPAGVLNPGKLIPPSPAAVAEAAPAGDA
ncbi:FAD-binding oxidoreductase [Streptomyces sp. DSM 42041]|uniref:FAD-binding oxidoreductase n=1 Tax=Streptomyces hazeniae TaxID=3075538 RepID=A0ABU2NXQ0_9ACTN|nr:FAD-binding oxidoreductase [Streptomyces sp. DSM 42041]MDT0381776.1 FAD-binding oxidoreductase [Streptomyces sp. DSM 42041]